MIVGSQNGQANSANIKDMKIRKAMPVRILVARCVIL
jgi:hypothetical protein